MKNFPFKKQKSVFANKSILFGISRLILVLMDLKCLTAVALSIILLRLKELKKYVKMENYITRKCKFLNKRKTKSPYNYCTLKYKNYVFREFKMCNFDEYVNALTYKSGNQINYITLGNKIFTGGISWKMENNKPIITYDIDLLSRNVYFITDEGLYKFCWGLEKFETTSSVRLTRRFSDAAKLRFDQIGKLLYISDKKNIYISTYKGREFTTIIQDDNISTFDIISEIGYSLKNIEF